MERVCVLLYRIRKSLTKDYSIRYAAPPTGSLRWQPPQPPAVNRAQVLPGDTLPQRCPQAPDSPIAAGYNFTGNEDCLFLSVYAPQNATNLPVLVWIHGGGYGAGQGNEDLTAIINANNNNFVGVAIQYRVGYTENQILEKEIDPDCFYSWAHSVSCRLTRSTGMA